MNNLRQVLTLAAFTICNITQAQLTPNDSAQYFSSLQHVAMQHRAFIGGQAGIYNGIQYTGHPYKFQEGHPFFGQPTPYYGFLVYDGQMYDSVQLQYDEVKNVVALGGKGNAVIQLQNERISVFSLGSDRFVNLPVSPGLSRAGFYQELYKGKLQALQRESKSVYENTDASERTITRMIRVKRNFFLLYKGRYHAIDDKKDLLTVLRDRKKEIQQYIRLHDLSFKKEPASALAAVAAYYDTL